jgi:cyclopropane-fatty-acyl-phospholipid synthase
MTSESLVQPEGLIGRALVAIGRKLMPQDLRGGLYLTLPSGRRFDIGFRNPGVTADLKLNSFAPVWSSIRRGAVGFSESYLAGGWESENVTALLRFYLQNRRALDSAARRVFYKSIGDRIWHLMRDNDRDGARRNISEHYDLGNDFYRLWLDPGMTYSSAYFGRSANALEEAQRDKYRAVLHAIGAEPGAHLLEIGCGWGGFAEEATRQGYSVTGITISAAQHDYAAQRLAGTTAEIRLQDYRDTRGTFDGIASIEMIEAVGEAHWAAYFRTLRDRLKAGASAAIQAITIDEQFYPDYRSSADFIQRYIFPGGMLPTRQILREQALAAGLRYEQVLAFGSDYARTLAQWLENFEAAWPQVSALGFDERFRRRWRYYLAYCEAGFAERAIDVGIYRFTRA